MIDISTVRYDVELITENGTRYPLNNALISLQWEEQISELAQRATLTVANAQTGSASLMDLMKINCIIQISGRWGEGGKTLLFDGTIWEWQYTNAVNKELTITVYDRLIRLQQSKDFKYYSAGMTTQAIIGDICNDWGIPLSYKWKQSLTHEKKAFSALKISDMIITEILEEVRQKTGEKYVVYFRDGQLQITGYGSNATVYRFDAENTISTSDKLTINDLVTRVKIIGKQNDGGRASVDAILDGDTRYGVLQEIIRRDTNKTLEATKAEAAALIETRGKPEEIIQIAVPDLPFLRKGDKLEVDAGNLIGFFFVAGVAHNATARQMAFQPFIDLGVNRPASASGAASSNTTENGSDFQKGDAIILNGAVYADSYGNGKGRTFTNHRNTITNIAPLDRPCPYHIGTIGWVKPDSITRG